MAEYFGREFDHINQHVREELRDLERYGCIYTQFVREGSGSGYCRIQFKPDEIVQYVDAIQGYDEFLEYRDRGFSVDRALESISDDRIKKTVRDYNESRDDPSYAPAAFLGGELEALVCGSEPDRYEFIQESYTGDREFLLTEVIEGFPESVSILQDRDGERPDYEITCEQDVQDLLFAVMKPIFPDARDEEYTKKHGNKSKRVDFSIPEISTVIEAKYVRNASHANNISDELKVDVESYHTHPDCDDLIAVIWDGESHITDRSNFKNDLSGSRSFDGTEFEVEVKIIP